MERGARLRSVTNKKLIVDCPHRIDETRTCVQIVDFEAATEDGTPRKLLNAGDSVTLRAPGSMRVMDRVVLIRAHPELYAAGVVTGLPMLVPSDGDVVLEYRFTANRRISLTKLGYLAELFVGA